MLRGKERYTEAVQSYDAVIERLRNTDQRHWMVFFSRGIAFERLRRCGPAPSSRYEEGA